MSIEGRFSEFLEKRRYNGDCYTICELERGEKHGGEARISLINKETGTLKCQAFSVYPMELPDDKIIIKNLYQNLKNEIKFLGKAP